MRLSMFAACAVLVCVGCKSRSISLKDTEGRSFTWDPATTMVTSTASPSPAPPKVAPAVRTGFDLTLANRFVEICEGAEYRGEQNHMLGITDRKCRLVVCDSTRDCPQISHGDEDWPVCARGLCAAAKQSIGAQDVYLLCVAGRGVPQEPMSAIEREAYQKSLQACASDKCQVPPECRQP